MAALSNNNNNINLYIMKNFLKVNRENFIAAAAAAAAATQMLADW